MKTIENESSMKVSTNLLTDSLTLCYNPLEKRLPIVIYSPWPIENKN